MRLGLGRRLVPLSTLAFGGLLVAIVVAIALYAFGTYADHVRRDADLLLREAAATARELPPRAGAVEAGRRIASRFIQPALLVVFGDARSRVTVLRERGTRATIVVRAPADRRLPEAPGSIARLTMGLATAFGLATLRTHAGRFDINVDIDRPQFVANVRSFLPAVLCALVAAVLIALAASRVFERSAMRPLVDVTRALERFALGDFTTEIVRTDGSRQLGALAIAYNGAARQVEDAFAERARANAVMRQFVADGGHQLRTPLTVIRGFVGILRTEIEHLSRGEIEHILTSMAQQTTVMGSLIDKLTILEQWEFDAEPAARIVDVAALARDVIAPLARTHPNRAIGVDASSAAIARIDPMDVRHAISNVLDNALKYTDGPIGISVRVTAGSVELEVTDTGPGMESAHAARAFDRFFRGSRRDVEGSGLGLAIAKRAVERSGGSIVFRSNVADGTRIAFVFKRATQTHP